MKKKHYTLLLFALVLTAFTANAQKQPQIQQVNLRAPDNVRIDGKMNEWPSPFLNAQKTDGYLSAYNSSSRIFYTVANDDNNLYFVIRGLGTGVANKELAGGMIITISKAIDKKRAKAADNVEITFPMPQDIKLTRDILGTLSSLGEFVDDDSVANRKQIDSIQSIANKKMGTAMKEIGVIGIKEITDSTISVYNTQGIKAAAGFAKRQPVVELAIPLKYLGLSTDNPVKFSYNIKMNAIPEVHAPPPPPSIAPGGAYPQPIIVGGYGANPTAGFLYNPTDFWGEYTLAKK